MTTYNVTSKPVNVSDVENVAKSSFWLMTDYQRASVDGVDAALGTLRALRRFVEDNVGVEGYQQEIERLATILIKGEQ